MGVYFEKVSGGKVPVAALAGEILGFAGSADAERFCDSDGAYRRKYNVYKISAGGKRYVLKKSDGRETAIYRDFLRGKGFAVPEYYGETEYGGSTWLLMEYVEGPDLRRFDREMALAGAETLAQIQNAYWEGGIEDGRFGRYWERINRRARCLREEPELAEAYGIFLERQKTCPRTLCSGDFLPLNGILRRGRAYMIDWGFGGMMPYALDAARLIAHGSEQPEEGGFPFYMDAALGEAFLRAHYERLERKPAWERYLADVRLAALNEYVEFLEADLNDPEACREEIEGSFYYRRARAAAGRILNG